MKEELSIQYRTIARQDQQFMSHLLGTFSHYQRALPVDCFFANSSDERITFKIVPTKDIQSPGNFLAFLIGARLILLPLTMGPTLP
ncbi:MAG: hypothetical protein KDD35_11210, partial [Bdellovibrionales bacterium]|nr:hypothetical protein [Bdellovibrionales bacterium]